MLPVLAAMDRKTLVKESGLHRRTIERYLYDDVIPRKGNLAVLTEIARTESRKRAFGER